jgi:DNA polymerase III subunit beta
MKLTIERGALLRSLGHVQSVVERRNTIPILSNILIEGAKDALHMTATDMDLSIVERTPASIGQGGATTVPAHTLYDIVRKLPEGAQVEIDGASDAGQLALRAGRARFSLATLPREDFPAVNVGDLPHRFHIPAEEMRTLIDRTSFAISTEETRYYLNGIYIHAHTQGKANALRAVATDGHRLARVELGLPAGAGEMPGVIVPRKAVAELRKLIDEIDGAIEVALSDTRISFAFADVLLTSKLIDGSFPDYHRVIPTGNDKMLTVDRKSFMEAVDLVATISSEKSRAVKLTLKEGHLTLSASSPENGTATEELEASYAGQPIEIGFNSRYLIDILRQIQGDSAEIALADAASPTLMKDPANGTALYVLMPMRV